MRMDKNNLISFLKYYFVDIVLKIFKKQNDL